MSDSLDDDFFAALRDLAPPVDPLFHPQYDEHAGVGHLRTARARLADGHWDTAVALGRDARRGGLPAELVPYGAAVLGAALALEGDVHAAEVVLRDAWRDHPDVAILPALLGSVYMLAGDATRAAYTMHAALVSEDPDRSLGLLRQLVMQLFAKAQRER